MSASSEIADDGNSEVADKKLLKFSLQQMEVLEAVAQGKSVFITGSAGTGKSYVLVYIIKVLKHRWGPDFVYITASTGLAACALGGTTLHSFAGIGLGTDIVEKLVTKVIGKKECRDRWSNAKALVIDEISMIDGELFDKLDYVAREVRKLADSANHARCFGGLQLIVTGDFFQLPPVKPPNLRKYFAFDANCWDHCFDLQVELKLAFRQSDEMLIQMLNEIREGCQSPQTLEPLKSCFHDLEDDGSGIFPTILYPLKVDVREENMKALQSLANPIWNFVAQDWFAGSRYENMLVGMRLEKELQLCVGAQVMLVKNLDTAAGLVNGSRGVVVGFRSFHLKERDLKAVACSINSTMQWPVVRFACSADERVIVPEKQSVELGNREVARRIQVPLILAWALSVHKCQGLTLDKVKTDLSKAFDYGMVYVALSRIKTLQGLQLLGFEPSRIKVHQSVVTFYNRLTSSQ